jgi:hypothetical protein
VVSTLYALHIPYPISYTEAKYSSDIPATFLLSLASDMCHVSSPYTSSLGLHRSTFLLDSDGSSSSAVGGCRYLYKPFTATWMPRVWWSAVTTHTSTIETRSFHPFVLMCTRIFAKIHLTYLLCSRWRRFSTWVAANSADFLDSGSSLCSSVRTTFLRHSLNECQIASWSECVYLSFQHAPCQWSGSLCYLTAYSVHSKLVVVLSMQKIS